MVSPPLHTGCSGRILSLGRYTMITSPTWLLKCYISVPKENSDHLLASDVDYTFLHIKVPQVLQP